MKTHYAKPATLTMILVLLLLAVAGTAQARFWHRGGTTIYYAIDRACSDGIEFGLADTRGNAGPLPIGLDATRLLDTTNVLSTTLQLPETPTDVPGASTLPHGGSFSLAWNTALDPGTRLRLDLDTFDNSHSIISVTTTIRNCKLSDPVTIPVRTLYEVPQNPRPVPPVGNGGSSLCSAGTDVTTTTLVAADDVVIDDLNLALDLEHSKGSSLEVTLTSPQGTKVTMIARGTGNDVSKFGSRCSDINGDLIGDDMADFVLDDDSVFRLTDSGITWDYQNTAWAPTGPGTLSDFIGENVAGTWTLDVCDTENDNLSGDLWCWYIEVLHYRLVSFSQDTYEVKENAGTVTIDVVLSETTANATEVTYTTVPGPGSNQQAVSGTVMFKPHATGDPGEKKRSFTVPIVDDNIGEADETMLVKLSLPTNDFNVGEPGEAQIIIGDDDASSPKFSSYLPVTAGNSLTIQYLAAISGINLENGRYVVNYETSGYTEQLPGRHVHFYFDTVAEADAGVPGKGPWILYGGPRPFTRYGEADRPAQATAMCIRVAEADHSIIHGTGNCYPLP